MSEREDDFELVRDTLEGHHAYHFRAKGPQPHDPDSCEVDDALPALARIQAHVEAQRYAIEAFARAVLAGEPTDDDLYRAKVGELMDRADAGEPEPPTTCPNIPGHETHMPYCGFSTSPLYSGHTVPTGTTFSCPVCGSTTNTHDPEQHGVLTGTASDQFKPNDEFREDKR